MRRSIGLGALAALIVVAGLSWLLMTRQPVTATSVPSPLLGHPAPNISGTTLDGHHFSLRADRGNVVVINFWASWCQPCRDEAPNISSFAWSERGHHVRVIGVVFNDTVGDATAFARYYGSLYPSLVDPGGTFAFAYGVTSPPTTFVINANGIVAATLIGPASQAQLANAVRKVAA